MNSSWRNNTKFLPQWNLLSPKHSPDRLEKDLCIKDQTPVFDVENIELNLTSKGVTVSSIDLCHTRHSRFHCQNSFLIISVVLNLFRQMWSRTDKWHISFDDIDEIGELIDRVSSHPSTDFCDTRIFINLKKWPIHSLVFLPNMIFLGFCINKHRTKLVDTKQSAIFPYSKLHKPRWSRCLFPY